MMVRVQVVFQNKEKLKVDIDRLATRKYLVSGAFASHTMVQMFSKTCVLS